MEHLVNGHDTYDTASAGGWCKEELETFQNLARKVSWVPAATADEVEAVLSPMP